MTLPINGEIDPVLAYRIKINGCRGDATSHGRRPPKVSTRREILAKQNDRCLYCDLPFGTEILRKGGKGKLVTLRINWDHFIPYAYCVNNPNDNWVAACHICNGIKGPRVFDTVAEARRYIQNRAIEKGYVYPRYA